MRRTLLAALAALVAWPCAMPAAAQAPAKSLRLIVGYAPGGPADAIGRAIAKELELEIKQTVVVENRAGAAGLIGLDAVTQSTPDGSTIGLLSNSSTTALHYGGKALDIDKRFIPLGQFVATRLILVVNPKVVNVNTLAELVQLAKREPGLSYSSSGHGSPGHLGMELFARQKGLRFTHIPYRGSAPAMQDLIAGNFGIKVVDASTAMPFVNAGTIRPIVTVSTVRPPSLPQLPTAMEQGEAAFQIDSTMALVVAPGTPAAVVSRLQAALKTAANGEGFTAHAQKVGNAKTWLEPAEYKVWLERDFEKWGKVIREAGITVDVK